MTAKNYKVLIIDDSANILQLLEKEFKVTPYFIETALDPAEAFELIQKKNFNIVISDIEMPGINGLELLKKIKNYNGMIQVVMMTGYITINNTLDAFRYGAENIFFKPLDIQGLIGAVDLCSAKLDRVNYLLDELEKRAKNVNSAKY